MNKYLREGTRMHCRRAIDRGEGYGPTKEVTSLNFKPRRKQDRRSSRGMDTRVTVRRAVDRGQPDLYASAFGRSMDRRSPTGERRQCSKDAIERVIEKQYRLAEGYRQGSQAVYIGVDPALLSSEGTVLGRWCFGYGRSQHAIDRVVNLDYAEVENRYLAACGRAANRALELEEKHGLACKALVSAISAVAHAESENKVPPNLPKAHISLAGDSVVDEFVWRYGGGKQRSADAIIQMMRNWIQFDDDRKAFHIDTLKKAQKGREVLEKKAADALGSYLRGDS